MYTYEVYYYLNVTVFPGGLKYVRKFQTQKCGDKEDAEDRDSTELNPTRRKSMTDKKNVIIVVAGPGKGRRMTEEDPSISRCTYTHPFDFGSITHMQPPS